MRRSTSFIIGGAALLSSVALAASALPRAADGSLTRAGAGSTIRSFADEVATQKNQSASPIREISFPTQDQRYLSAALAPEALAGLSPQAARERAAAWAAALRDRSKGSLRDALSTLLPSSTWFQARLMMPRDEPTLRGDALTAGAYGQAYKAILASLKPTRDAAPQLEAALAELWEALELGKGLKLGPQPPLARGERWLPTDRALGASHRYALDLFFYKVTRSGAEEKGPVVRSVSAGIVVAAADDWVGTDRPSQYEGGGLSPKAGNGLIIYAPHEGRYYAYFHLYDLKPRLGEVVEAGQALGHGGNSGVNARKKGHGEHLHIEIHESSGKVWTSQELKAFIAGLR
mgnify:CR=1 FL=1